MRRLTDVIDQMLDEIPEAESSLRAGLVSLKSSVAFTAPEVMHERWYQGGYLLTESFDPENLTDWQERVVNIWMDKSTVEGRR